MHRSCWLYTVLLACRSPETLPPDDLDSVWAPAPGTSWQWQLSGTIDTSVDVAMFDIDLFDTSQATIDGLHAAGRIVVCYFSAGSREDWRPDAAEFAPSDVGNALDGWPGEHWLDTRSDNVRAIMKARLDLALSKGCDGVEPDNVDAYDNDPGFPLSADTQREFNRFLAAEAHARSLSVGLKNALALVDDLLPDFDWALNEECFCYDECAALKPFIDAGKAVFHVEYPLECDTTALCGDPSVAGFSTLKKNLELDAWRETCP